MKLMIRIYLINLVSILILESIWLGVIAKPFFQKELSFFLKPSFNLPPAILFYLLFTLGLTIFVSIPSINGNSLVKGLQLATLFGLCTYATFDLTCYALFKNFPLSVVFVDLFWGTTLCCLTTLITYKLGSS
ncbi:DUF2177 domain-containing protein [Candidatus Marinamargulisbacteria bacterium SCGC AG-439-L15]|nr:DUF2177 domain-containing protein [Candidatus Marinamargulisbacteria bacterium SCGC AG-439-L15]